VSHLRLFSSAGFGYCASQALCFSELLFLAVLIYAFVHLD
jgi:hypothetical protein